VKTKDHWFRFITKHYNDETTIIVLSGFKKKSNKIPQNEIKKAEKIYERIFKGGHS
jgi:phage-related protein